MTKIMILPDDVVDQIAAGEVVERPAAVVKELIENAIDAGASRIELDIEAGGRNLIRVLDNGSGMSPEDLAVSVVRHATSKLSSVADLFNIHSLGFRGEALPSIAAVSRFTIASRVQGASVGRSLTLKGGTMEASQDVGMPAGTHVEVRDLFFNTPARLKFLKSETAEAQRIVQMVERMTLSRPDIRFVLRLDGRVAMESPGNESLLDAATVVFGDKAARQLRPIKERDGGGVVVSGLLGLPELNRNNRSWQYLFLNGRYIEHRGLGFALEEAYRSLMPVRRYPVGVINLIVPPEFVDVNVHPTKVEVRFQDERKIVSVVLSILRQEVESICGTAIRSAEGYVTESVYPGDSNRLSAPGSHPLPRLSHNLDFFATRSVPPDQQVRETYEIQPASKSYRLIGQVLNSYILLEREKGLCIVDQHAAHERILYEEFRRAGERRVQRMAVPLSIDFAAAAKIVPRYLDAFHAMGFDLDHFGGSTYLLRSMPDCYRGDFSEEILLDLMQEMAAEQVNNQEEKVAIALACRAAIKANTRMSSSEMIDLLDRLYATPLSVTCPHGRPVELIYGSEQLFKLFHPR